MSPKKINIQVMEQLFLNRKRFERFAILYVRDSAEAQDILMESYAYIWEHRETLDPDINLESYMFSVIKHKCLDWLDHQSVRRNAENNILSDAQWELEMNISTLKAFDPSWMYDEDVIACIKNAVRRLPDTSRQIFILSRVHNKTYREIAQELGISIKTVEFHISKALRTLRDDLGKFYPVLILLLIESGQWAA